MFGRIMIATSATILLLGIASALYGYTRPPTYDVETANMYFVIGIGMSLLGGLTTTLLLITTLQFRNSRG